MQMQRSWNPIPPLYSISYQPLVSEYTVKILPLLTLPIISASVDGDFLTFNGPFSVFTVPVNNIIFLSDLFNFISILFIFGNPHTPSLLIHFPVKYTLLFLNSNINSFVPYPSCVSNVIISLFILPEYTF